MERKATQVWLKIDSLPRVFFLRLVSLRKVVWISFVGKKDDAAQKINQMDILFSRAVSCQARYIATETCMMYRVFSQRFKSKPVYPACFLLVDDMDCPNVGGNGGNQDGDVEDGEGEREAVVHRGCCPGVQAEVQVPPQRNQPCFYLHVF